MDNFFDNINDALTFDDVLMVPSYSKINTRKAVELDSEIVNGWEFTIPLISANMNSVTEHDMVVAMSELGGTSALHRYMSPEMIHETYRKIKDYNWQRMFGISVGVNKVDYTKTLDLFTKDITLRDPMMYPAFVIIDVAHGDHSLVTEAIKDIKNRYSWAKIVAGNICTKHGALRLIDAGADSLKVGVGGGCFSRGTLIKVFNSRGQKGWKYVPIEKIKVGDEVLTHKGRFKRVVGLHQRYAYKRLYSINGILCTGNHEFYVLPKLFKYNVFMKANECPMTLIDMIDDDNIDFYAKWVPASELNKNYYLLNVHVDDPDRRYQYREIEEIKEECIGESIVYDFEVEDDHSYTAGGFAVHNSVCSTRIVTGCGYPQLSAIREVCDTVKRYNYDNCKKIKVIADGGIRNSGDCVKALASGADFVMLGSLLAGTDESPGEIINKPDGRYKSYRGMASTSAQAEFFKKDPDDITPEGISVDIPYKGSVKQVVKKLIGGIQSGFSYCGCENIRELQDYGCDPNSWVRVTNAGRVESTPHIFSGK